MSEEILGRHNPRHGATPDMPLPRRAAKQGVKPIESADVCDSTATKYRVWVELPEFGRNTWAPVSILFEKRPDAERWGRYLNTDRWRVEEEED